MSYLTVSISSLIFRIIVVCQLFPVTCSGLLKPDFPPVSFILLVFRILLFNCFNLFSLPVPASYPQCHEQLLSPAEPGTPFIFLLQLQPLFLSATAETGQVFIKEKPYPWLDSGSTKDVCQETRMDIGYRVMAKQFETRSCSCFRGPGVQLSLHTQHLCWGSVWGAGRACGCAGSIPATLRPKQKGQRDVAALVRSQKSCFCGCWSNAGVW